LFLINLLKVVQEMNLIFFGNYRLWIFFIHLYHFEVLGSLMVVVLIHKQGEIFNYKLNNLNAHFSKVDLQAH